MRSKREIERPIQVAIVNYLRLNKIMCFSVPNGGHRGKFGYIIGKKLKEEGVLAGVSDIVIVLPKECVFVEVKSPKKGSQQPSQKKFQSDVEELGHKYYIWKSLDDCIEFVSKNKKKVS